ncbi:hypothetical protein FB451DRAFT_1556266 [Mycena latifolia]|nr:hypothetical protein FB451DRAFT_1556266 [Mycena latifolia]
MARACPACACVQPPISADEPTGIRNAAAGSASPRKLGDSLSPPTAHASQRITPAARPNPRPLLVQHHTNHSAPSGASAGGRPDGKQPPPAPPAFLRAKAWWAGCSAHTSATRRGQASRARAGAADRTNPSCRMRQGARIGSTRAPRVGSGHSTTGSQGDMRARAICVNDLGACQGKDAALVVALATATAEGRGASSRVPECSAKEARRRKKREKRPQEVNRDRGMGTRIAQLKRTRKENAMVAGGRTRGLGERWVGGGEARAWVGSRQMDKAWSGDRTSARRERKRRAGSMQEDCTPLSTSPRPLACITHTRVARPPRSAHIHAAPSPRSQPPRLHRRVSIPATPDPRCSARAHKPVTSSPNPGYAAYTPPSRRVDPPSRAHLADRGAKPGYIHTCRSLARRKSGATCGAQST